MEPRNVQLYFVDIFATLKPCIMMPEINSPLGQAREQR